jgi:hypothetical protein
MPALHATKSHSKTLYSWAILRQLEADIFCAKPSYTGQKRQQSVRKIAPPLLEDWFLYGTGRDPTEVVHGINSASLDSFTVSCD